MILMTLALALAPSAMLWTNEQGREVSVRYASERACERARPAVQRRMERYYQRARRVARERGVTETRWALLPICMPPAN